MKIEMDLCAQAGSGLEAVDWAKPDLDGADLRSQRHPARPLQEAHADPFSTNLTYLALCRSVYSVPADCHPPFCHSSSSATGGRNLSSHTRAQR